MCPCRGPSARGMCRAAGSRPAPPGDRGQYWSRTRGGRVERAVFLLEPGANALEDYQFGGRGCLALNVQTKYESVIETPGPSRQGRRSVVAGIGPGGGRPSTSHGIALNRGRIERGEGGVFPS